MRQLVRIRFVRAPEIFVTFEKLKSASRTRSILMFAGTAATAFWNKSDPYQGLRKARLEQRQSARLWLRRAEAARLRAESVHHHESRPQEKSPRHVRPLYR